MQYPAQIRIVPRIRDLSSAMSTVAEAIAIVCGEIILPAVAPEVLAAEIHSGEYPVAMADFFCSSPSRIFEEVSLPVTNVPSAPSEGAISGKNLPTVPEIARATDSMIPEYPATFASGTMQRIVNAPGTIFFCGNPKRNGNPPKRKFLN